MNQKPDSVFAKPKPGAKELKLRATHEDPLPSVFLAKLSSKQGPTCLLSDSASDELLSEAELSEEKKEGEESEYESEAGSEGSGGALGREKGGRGR